MAYPDFGFGGNHGGFFMGGRGGTFKRQYKCFSVAFSQSANPKALEEGGKIIMPPSALNELTRLNIQYPMLFKLTGSRINRATHCGVLEFIAEEGKIFIPHWMMNNIGLKEEDLVWLENVTLPLATFVKFQPQSVDFLDITDQKAVLELKLRNFACLTLEDVIVVHYNDKKYHLKVLESKPANAVSIIECDMRVDFAAPVGYKPPKTPETPIEDTDSPFAYPSESDFVPFGGQGERLDGKKKKTPKNDKMDPPQVPRSRGIPNYEYKVGKLSFVSAKKLEAYVKKKQSVAETLDFKPFGGDGQQLKPRRSKTT